MTDIEEADVDQAVARAFGRSTPGSESLFREAGFNDELAARGARLMESGQYLDFQDVATTLMGTWGGSLGADNRPKAPGVTVERIAEVAKRAGIGVEVTEDDTAEDEAAGVGVASFVDGKCVTEGGA